MKVAGIIIKIVVALAAVAGIVYLAAAYGDRIVAWAKKMISRCKKADVVIFDEDADIDPDSVIASESDFVG